MAQKRYLFTPGPTPVPPQVLAALGRAGAPPPRAGLPRGLRARARPAQGRRIERRPRCSSSPARGRARSSRRSSTSARPVSACSPSRPGSFGERWAAMATHVRLRASRSSATRGARRPTAGGPARKLGGDRAGLARLPRPLGDVDRRRRGHPGARGGRRRRRARSSSSTPSRASAPCRSRWTTGASTSSSPGSQKALMTPPGLATRRRLRRRLGAGRALDAAELLLRLGARRARRRRQLDSAFTPAVSLIVAPRRRARRCCSTSGLDDGVRAPRPPRPRLPRRDQGDGARALLARTRTAPPSSPRRGCRTGSTRPS